MSYKLFIGGEEHVITGLMYVSKKITESLYEGPVDFTVQYFGKEGRFEHAFGGTAKLESGKLFQIDYSGFTTDNANARGDMQVLNACVALFLRADSITRQT